MRTKKSFLNACSIQDMVLVLVTQNITNTNAHVAKEKSLRSMIISLVFASMTYTSTVQRAAKSTPLTPPPE